MTDTSRPLERSGRRGGRRLSPVQKYEAFVQVLTGEMTVVECADHWGVDRSTIMRAREVAKKGALDALASSRPGTRSGGVDPELVMARDDANASRAPGVLGDLAGPHDRGAVHTPMVRALDHGHLTREHLHERLILLHGRQPPPPAASATLQGP